MSASSPSSSPPSASRCALLLQSDLVKGDLSNSFSPSLPANDTTPADATQDESTTYTTQHLIHLTLSISFCLSFVFLLCSIVLFLSTVTIIPTRESSVEEYNSAVLEWEQQHRLEFEQQQFVCQHNFNTNVQFVVFQPNTSQPQLNDAGIDLQHYSALSYTASIQVSVISSTISASQPLPQFLLVCNQTQSKLQQQQLITFNVTLPLIHHITSLAVSRASCESSLFGAYQSNDESCLHFIQLQAICLRVGQVNEGCFFDGNQWRIGEYISIANPNQAAEQIDATLVESAKSQLGQDFYVVKRRLLGIAASTELHKDNTQSQQVVRAIAAETESSASNQHASTGESQTSTSTAVSDLEISSSTGALAPDPARHTFTLLITFRHQDDPLLVANRLTNATYWFGLSRQSLLLLSFLLFICAAMLFLPPSLSYIVYRNHQRISEKKRSLLAKTDTATRLHQDDVEQQTNLIYREPRQNDGNQQDIVRHSPLSTSMT